MQRRKYQAGFVVVALVLAGAVAAVYLAPSEDTPTDLVEPVARALKFYETRPQFETPLAYTPVPDSLGDMRAETCGACHQEIYKEWAVSTHRRAWLDDQQFQQELAKSRGAHEPEKGDVGWMCVNCHTPLVNQLPQLVVGLKDGKINQPIYVDNPTYDARLQLDAITCAGCHVRDGIIHGPYGDTNAPHPTVKDESLLTEEACTRCHQAEQLYQEQNLGCFFSTGDEWAASTHASHGRTCQSCHMPEVERKVAEAFDVPIRKTRRHWFGGSLIPKKPEYEAELAPLRPIFGDGVQIDLKVSSSAKPLAVDALAEADRKIHNSRFVDGCEASGEGCRELAVVLTNISGHRMPSGDPERHIDIEIVAQTADGAIVARRWYRLNSRYAWWPKIEKMSDTRLMPDETRALVVRVPDDVPLDVVIVGEKYRMYADAFEYHELEGKYVRGRRFYEQRWSVGADSSVRSLDESVE